MSRYTFLEATLLVVFTSKLIAGCGLGPEADEVIFENKLAVSPGSSDSLASMVIGQLYEGENCILLKVEGGGEYLPVFPQENISSDPSGEVMMFEGQPLRFDVVQKFGGGEMTPPQGSTFKRAAEHCGTEKIWLVS